MRPTSPPQVRIPVCGKYTRVVAIAVVLVVVWLLDAASSIAGAPTGKVQLRVPDNGTGNGTSEAETEIATSFSSSSKTHTSWIWGKPLRGVASLGHYVRSESAYSRSVARNAVQMAKYDKASRKRRARWSKKHWKRWQQERALRRQQQHQRQSREAYGWLARAYMSPVWFALLVAMIGWMGAILEERLLPCVRAVCSAARVPEDVAGATVLALATGGFEVLFSAVETLEGEVGVGLSFVLGSGVVNFGLLPPIVAMCAAASSSVTGAIELELLPILRDGAFALVAFAALLFVVRDGAVSLAESVALLSLYAAHVAACVAPLWWRPFEPPPHQPTPEAIMTSPSCESGLEVEPDEIELVVSSQRDAEGDNNCEESSQREFAAARKRQADDLGRAACCPLFLLRCVRKAPADVPAAWRAFRSFLLPPAPHAWVLDCKQVDASFPDAKARVAAVLRAVAWPLAGCGAWLVALLLLLTRLADLVALSARIPLGFAASVFLPLVYAVPDVLVSAATARHGKAEAAIANSLGVQVVTVLLGVGLPFTLANLRARWRGDHHPIRVDDGDCDASLRWGVFALGSTFVALVLAPALVSKPGQLRRRPHFSQTAATIVIAAYVLLTFVVTLRTI